MFVVICISLKNLNYVLVFIINTKICFIDTSKKSCFRKLYKQKQTTVKAKNGLKTILVISFSQFGKIGPQIVKLRFLSVVINTKIV